MCLPITLINFSSAGNLQSKPYRIDLIKGNVGRIDRIKGDVGEKIKQKHKDCADKQKIKHIVERQPHHHWNHATRTRAQMHPHAQLKHVNKGRYLQRKDAQHTHASIVATLKHASGLHAIFFSFPLSRVPLATLIPISPPCTHTHSRIILKKLSHRSPWPPSKSNVSSTCWRKTTQ